MKNAISEPKSTPRGRHPRWECSVSINELARTVGASHGLRHRDFYPQILTDALISYEANENAINVTSR
jgi:hypothetical protein